MREILFRGKICEMCKYQGEWLTGYYAVDDGKPIIAIPEKNGINGFMCYPKTVGQYTGQTDKNGKKVFEGDILSGQLDDLFPTEESIYEVVWHDYGWHIRNNSGIDTADKEWIRQYFKVIGNIYDNPELMGGESNG